MPSISRRFMPLSITCVRPSTRGFPGRAGRSRNPSKPGIELLQFFVGRGLDVVVERIPVGVDPDRERAEVLDAELPEALGHQLLPGHLFDLLDLRRLERGRAADDREIDHPECLHGFDGFVREAALAADRADAVLRTQRLGEAHHARRGRGADAELLVRAAAFGIGADLADVRRRVQQERTGEIHRRLDALVEDADLRAVADADDVTLDDDLVARAELQDLALVGDREGDLVHRHQAAAVPAMADRDEASPDAARAAMAGAAMARAARTCVAMTPVAGARRDVAVSDRSNR